MVIRLPPATASTSKTATPSRCTRSSKQAIPVEERPTELVPWAFSCAPSIYESDTFHHLVQHPLDPVPKRPRRAGRDRIDPSRAFGHDHAHPHSFLHRLRLHRF